MKCTKAIIAVAGYGTRRLPIAKAVEKCMLPLLNRPVVDYAVADCIQAGVRDIYFVVSGDARQLRDYYERQPVLEDYLRAKDKPELIEAITPPQGITFHYISQDLSDGRYGTSIPVWLCRDYIEDDEHFFVVMGDQTLYRSDGGSEASDLKQRVEKVGSAGGLIGNEIDWDQIANFGIIEKDDDGNYRRIIEHPKAGEVNTNLNNSSFYLFPAGFFDYLDTQIADKQTSEGEYFIIDAINSMVQDGKKMTVYTSQGTYLECGSLENWVKANQWLFDHS
ncbi:MAG: sugar phosphate nucleotidyltransferase [Candidatus Saccharimonadales bacterium]